jgi:hypothetical protein
MSRQAAEKARAADLKRSTRPTDKPLSVERLSHPISGELGEHDTLLSIAKARRILDYSPQHSWRHM